MADPLATPGALDALHRIATAVESIDARLAHLETVAQEAHETGHKLAQDARPLLAAIGRLRPVRKALGET